MRQKPPKPTPVVSKLERVTRGGRRIVSIERSDCLVVVTEAKVGELGKPKPRTYESPAAAEHAVRELEADLAGKGYVPIRLPPGSTAVRGRVARDPELERAIEADLDDDAGFLVYADWLSSQGDVRGELIRAQLELEQHPEDKPLTATRDTLLSKFAKELLGPLAKHSIIRDPNAYLPGFRWRRGFICAARLWRFSREPTMEGLLSMLLEHPAGRFLERLVLGRPFWGDRASYQATLSVLEARAPRTLRSIELAEGEDAFPGDIAGFLRLPHLRRLVVHNQPLSIEDLDESHVEELALDVGQMPSDDVLSALARIRWPKLRRLTVPVGVVPVLGAIFSNAPTLRRLGVSYLSETAAAVLGKAAFLDRLDELTLEECTSPERLARAAPSLSVIPRVAWLRREYILDDLTAVPAEAARVLPQLRIEDRPSFDALDVPLGPRSGVGTLDAPDE